MSFLPDVIKADLIAAGDHVGQNDLTYAAAPVTCGHDIEVPDMMLYGTCLVSSGSSVTVEAGDHAAKMSTPGAVRSGYIYQQERSELGYGGGSVWSTINMVFYILMFTCLTV